MRSKPKKKNQEDVHFMMGVEKGYNLALKVIHRHLIDSPNKVKFIERIAFPLGGEEETYKRLYTEIHEDITRNIDGLTNNLP